MGEPLDRVLRKTGLVPHATVPLVQSAERLGNLPWALRELGELLGQSVERRLRRFSLICNTTALFALGVVTGCLIATMFYPLVDLLTKYAERAMP
jgi:protein transport protein HofC